MKHLLITTIAAVLLVGTAFADPIHDAARNGNVAGVQAELDKGVDVNAKDTFFFMDSGVDEHFFLLNLRIEEVDGQL